MKDEIKPAGKATRLIFDIATMILPAVVAVAVVFTFLFRTAGVDGLSMYPTLDDGDRLIITAFLPEPSYGDIVVASQPNPLEKTLIKRVIATEGQTIDIDFNRGMVFVDNEVIHEPYIAELTAAPEDFSGPVTVPEGFVFVMGDNRNRSTDSRSSLVGLISEQYLMGKVVCRLSPSFSTFGVDTDE